MRRSTLPLLLALSSGCTDLRDLPPPGEAVVSKAQRITSVAPDQDVAEASAANTAFGLALLARHPDDNFIFSPYSVTSATSMLEAGAATTTLSGITQALRQTLPPAQHHRAMNTLEAALEVRGATAKAQGGRPFRLVVTNQLFAQKGQHLEAPFLDTLAQEYGSGLRLLDFSTDAARVSINQWVGQRTEGKIPALFRENALTGARLVIVNTLYFRANWSTAFPVANTKAEPFHGLDGSVVDVPTMHHSNVSGRAAVVDGVQVAELSYDGDDTALVIVAPPAGTFATFERGFDASKYDALVSKVERATMDLHLPKLTLRSDFDLTPDLEAFGMGDAFVPGKADFSGMTGDRTQYLAVAVHQAVIIVDESGTEAAAATGFATRVTAALQPVEVVIDRPFLFFLRDVKTGLVLFAGRVVRP
ncbi:MAG: serpin family protein [Archangiaceae bacterium]|nr:serpin family protein [Archangiaceae bacterium]